MSNRFQVYLSYNTDEPAEVLALAQALRERGVDPWLDLWELSPGMFWQKELERVLSEVPTAAVLVGREGLGPWQERESCAMLEEFVRRGARVIPVLLPSAPDQPQLPLFLRGFTWVDLRGGLSAAGVGRLVWGVTGERPADVVPGPPTLPSKKPWSHNLPWSSLGSTFKGREKELNELAAALGMDPATAAAKSQVICGLGGIGKTRLAIEFAWSRSQMYHSAFFVGASTPESLRHGIAELADSRRLDLRLGGVSDGDKVEAVLGWLTRNRGWLLVLDSVDSPEAQQAVRRLLPLDGGHLLVTSRLAHWPTDFERRTLKTLERKDSVALLLETTHTEACDDAALADSLADLLGDLPLALEQAGAYIDARGSSFATYLEAWKHDRQEILGWYDMAATHYPLAIALTWSQSVESLGPQSRALLRLLSHLSAAPVPLALLTSSALLCGDALMLLGEEGLVTTNKSSRIDVLGALAELVRFSLVARHNGSVSVHRMVQEVERSRIPASRRTAWIERAIRMISDFAPRPPDDVRTWAIWDDLLPHAERVIELAWSEGIAQPTAALMIELGILLSSRGQHGQAESLLRRALMVDEVTFGSRHPRLAVDLNNLAQVVRAAGRLEEAESLMRQALEIDEEFYGAEHDNVARHLNNLAALLKATGRLAEAEPLMRRALAIDERVFGPRHPRVAIRLNNLAMLLEATQRHDEAEPMARRALAISEEAFGPHHPRVASRLVNLGNLLLARGCGQEAEPLVQRALVIDQHAYGPNHPSVARDFFTLAMLARDRGEVEAAVQHCRRSLEICRLSLGGSHPRTCSLGQSLAELEGGLHSEKKRDEGDLETTSTIWQQ